MLGIFFTFVWRTYKARIIWLGDKFYRFIAFYFHRLYYIASNKWCYKIELDKSNSTIIFYRLYNRVVRTFKFDKIKIVIDSYCHIFIGDPEFILHAEYFHDLVSLLPSDTVIEYNGRIGKYKEKHWIKGPLIPGNRL